MLINDHKYLFLSIKRKVLKSFKHRMNSEYHLRKFKLSKPGSTNWLIGAEMKYGGLVRVKRRRISSLDPHRNDRIGTRCIGGDRMLSHGYAYLYSLYLEPYVRSRREPLTLCEFGILNGTGLAIWCDLFSNSTCLGFDIDLRNIRQNMDNLTQLGAFRKNSPSLHQYDQFTNGSKYLGEILNGLKIDICIDDGDHSDEAVIMTLSSVFPHLKDKFAYFIEDNRLVHLKIGKLFPEIEVVSDGAFTILTRKTPN